MHQAVDTWWPNGIRTFVDKVFSVVCSRLLGIRAEAWNLLVVRHGVSLLEPQPRVAGMATELYCKSLR